MLICVSTIVLIAMLLGAIADIMSKLGNAGEHVAKEDPRRQEEESLLGWHARFLHQEHAGAVLAPPETRQ
eukprot:scaffold3315_cov124-Pinguiococcus_pyrenoidosus.AAC.1